MSCTPPYLLLGESPNAATVGHPSLWLRPDLSGKRHSANRLLIYTGYSLAKFLMTFERDNLLRSLPPRSAKGREFPRDDAHEAAGRIHAQADGRRVIMLGRRVASAFMWMWCGRSDAIPLMQFFPASSWSSEDTFQAAIVPHPSGVNRWWNDTENRRKARDFFASL